METKSWQKMIKRAILLLLTATISLTIFNACEKGTEPQEPQPGRRDYTWTVDTLKTFNTPISKMWGTAPNNVWAVGNGSGSDQTIWHFNGAEWKTDGKSRPLNPWCIYGFARDDIWIGGGDGKIWHYDGVDWSESLGYSEELNFHYYNIYFMDIWGETPDDVYAVGFADSSDVALGDVRFGIMMHYDGTEWSRLNVQCPKGFLAAIRKVGKNSNKYYLSNYMQHTNPATEQFLEFDGENFTEIFNEIDHQYNMTIIDNELVFSFNHNAYLYSNNKFKLIAQNPLADCWNSVYGRNRKDLFWLMADGLTHYNGTNVEYILNFDQKSLSHGVVFEKEVFFLAEDFYNKDANNLIYHGVLK